MAKVGRRPKNWKSVPVKGKLMTVIEAAKMMEMKENTLHQQLNRNRALCVSDGHSVKQENGRWHIHESIKHAFEVNS